MESLKSLQLMGPSGIILLGSIICMVLYLVELKKTDLTLRKLIVTSVFVAISFLLYNIKFIRYPQGGGISLFPMLPIMLVGILYGRGTGLTAGLILGMMKLMDGGYVIHPAQFMLDFILSTMALGLAGIFGDKTKTKLFLGCLIAVILSVGMNIISGVVYFGQYAPEGMNVFIYSCIYNLSSAGVEGLLTCMLIISLPMNTIKKALRSSMGSDTKWIN